MWSSHPWLWWLSEASQQHHQTQKVHVLDQHPQMGLDARHVRSSPRYQQPPGTARNHRQAPRAVLTIVGRSCHNCKPPFLFFLIGQGGLTHSGSASPAAWASPEVPHIRTSSSGFLLGTPQRPLPSL